MKLAEAFIEILAKDETGPVIDGAKGKVTDMIGGVSSGLLTLGTGAVLAGATAAAGAVVGIGAAAFSSASQVKDATNVLQSQLGISAGEAERLGGVVRDVFANNFGESIGAVGEAVAIAGQQFSNFGDMADSEIQSAVESAFALQDAFGTDLDQSMNAANALMTNFGMSSQQAFDFITAGMQQGLNSSGDFLDSIGEYSTQFANGGATAGQFFSVMETGLGSGMLGTDKAADMFKEFTLRIQDGSTGTAEALGAIGLSADDMAAGFADGSLTAAQAFDMVQQALAETDDQNVQFQAGVALMGGQFEDMGTSAALGVSTAETALKDLSGATESLNAQYDNFPAMFEGFKRSAMDALVPLGEILLDLANRAMPAVEAGFAFFESAIVPAIEAVADVFGEFLDNIDAGMTPIEALKDALSEIIPPEAMAAVETFIDIISNVFGTALENAQLLIDGFKAALEGDFGTLFENIVQIVQNNIQLIVDVIGSLAEMAGPALASAWDAISNWFASQDWAAIGRTVVELIVDGLYNLIELANDVLAQAANAFADWVNSIDWVDVGYQVVKAIIEGLKFLIIDLPPMLADWAQAFWNFVTTYDWAALGQAIIDGVIAGLSNAAGAVGDAMRGIAQGAVNAAKEALGIHSPSRVFAEIGAFLMAGLATGITQNAGQANTAMDGAAAGLASGAAQSFSEALRSVASAIQPAIDALMAVFDFSFDRQGLVGKIFAFTDVVMVLVNAFASSASHLKSVSAGFALKEANEFSATVEAVVGVIADAIETLFTLETLVVPDVNGVSAELASQLAALVGAFAEAAAVMSVDALVHAQVFADAAEAVVGLLESALEPIRRLSLMDFASVVGGMHLANQIQIFRNIIRTLMREFGEAASEMSGELATAVGEFAGSAEGVIGLIEDALIAVQLLAAINFGEVVNGPNQHLADQIRVFRNIIRTIIREFAEAASEMSGELMGGVKSFADAAGAVVGMIEEAISGAQMLAEVDFGPVVNGPNQHLAEQIRIFRNIIRTIMREFAEAASEMSVELMDAVRSFAQAADAVVGIIESAIEGTKMLAAVDFGEVLQGDHLTNQIRIFRNIVREMMQQFAEAASEMSGELMDAVGRFADAAATVFGLLQDGVASLEAIASSEMPDTSPVMKYLLEQANLISLALTSASATASGTVVAAAQAFALNVKLMVAGIEDAVNEMARLLTANVPGTLQGILNEMVAAMNSQMASGWNQMVSATKAGGLAISAEARRIAQMIVDAFMAPDWDGIGYRIAQGIANGLKRGSSLIQNAARDAANRALQASQQALGIASPSKLAEREIGVPFVQGIAKGITDVGPVQSAINNLVNVAMPQMAVPALAGAGQAQQTPQTINIHVKGKIEDETISVQVGNGGVLSAARARGLR